MCVCGGGGGGAEMNGPGQTVQGERSGATGPERKMQGDRSIVNGPGPLIRPAKNQNDLPRPKRRAD